jgi:hypothetical protein
MVGMGLILSLAILLFQGTGSPPRSTPNPVSLAVGTNCEWISQSQTELSPVAQACEAALRMRESMPNFVCDLKVKRKQMGRRDIVTAEVTYLSGHEQFGNIRINGNPIKDPNAAQARNWTSGEFSPPGLAVLESRSIATFAFQGETVVRHEQRADFDFSVPQPNEAWMLTFFGRNYTPAFHGSMSIDKRTGFVRNFTMIADQLPGDVPYSLVKISTDYDSVAISGLGVYQLPVHAVLDTCQHGSRQCDQNVKEFTGCRRFAAKSRIIINP